jgi:signal transduction histidine kinase/ligand-binding sensor domain-containing protein/DNA-binding response OmpR family regulator
MHYIWPMFLHIKNTFYPVFFLRYVLSLAVTSFSLSLLGQNKPLRFEHITVEDGLAQSTIHGIVQDKYGFLWFGTWEGLCRYDGIKFTVYRNDPSNPNTLNNNRILLLMKDSSKVMWVATFDSSTLCRYNYETDDFTRFPRSKVKPYISKRLVRAINLARNNITNGKLTWKVNALDHLLSQTDNRTGNQIVYHTDPMNRWSLTDDDVSDIYMDNNDILWVGTTNGGINKAYTKSKPFKYLHHTISYNSLINNIIRAVCEDQQGNLWIGTNTKGITRIDRKNNVYTHFQKSENEQNGGLISNSIRKIYCDRFGFMWIGTKNGLDRYDPKNNRFYHYSTETKSKIPHNYVYWVMEDHCGYLWIATWNGIAKYNRKTDRFLAYDPKTTLKHSNTRVIIEDKNNNLWVATEGGGITEMKRDSSAGFAEKLTPVHHYMHDITNNNSLINSSVYAFMQDEDGIFWAGTSGGISRFDVKKNSFTNFTFKNGLPDEFIVGFLPDTKGNLWISHKKGLTKFNRKTFAMNNYTIQDGLQGIEFTENAFFKSPETGEMFFGGTDGLNSFYPDSITDNQYIAKVYITDLQIFNEHVPINAKVNGRVILRKSIMFSDEIALTYSDKSISIEFAALHYTKPRSIKYAYMLDGFDKGWIKTNALKRIATYSNLEPGSYVFKVKATNGDGIWNPTPVVLRITVLPPLWRTWWAYCLYFILIILVLYLLYRYLVSREKLKNQILIERMKLEKTKELDRMKTQFFTSISHEFRTPLTLIIDPLNKLNNEELTTKEARYYYKLMSRNAQRLMRLINQLLDFRKMEAGHMKVENTPGDLIGFVKTIGEVFHAHASHRNIHFEIKSPLDSLSMNFDHDKLEKILYNLISNALKYTSDGGEVILTVNVRSKPSRGEVGSESVELCVKDTGMGIPDEAMDKIFDIFYQVGDHNSSKNEGTGIGLALTKELITLLDGKITVESERGKGSCFKVTLPILGYSQWKEKSANVEPKLPINYNLTDVKEGETTSKIREDNPEYPWILVVDDNDDIRSYIHGELETNYRVAEAVNGAEGFEKATELIPDLIVSDIMMPGINGIEFCQKLKNDERTSHIPIILLTANQSDRYKVESYENGADAYVTKPFTMVILRARIKNLIESRQKLRELFDKATPFEIKKIAINITDEAFLQKAMHIVGEHISNTDFDGEMLAQKLKLSRSQLYRKIQALTNHTVHDFITSLRLNKAAELLASGELSISEVAYQVGYTQPNNFSRSFAKQFGLLPSNYILQLKSKH